MRAAALALLVFAVSACGKYGPPVRTETEQMPAPVSTAPPADTEQCEDPNAPSPAPGAQP